MNSTVTRYLMWAVIATVVVVAVVMILRPVAGIENVNAERAAELSASGVRTIDVRTPAEYGAGHIAGSELVPINEFAAIAAGWDRAEPLLIYCATGERSTSAIRFLSDQGFETVYHFNAGLIAWTGPLEQGTSTAVAPDSAPVPTGTPVMYEFFTDW
ncbi:MAG: rhodanese-like domain-containing protein [Coriobacteriia bacterium]|nr:rhodanese-like domain-containing protein [Coriobacteriia bacterium]